jgi:hypothetical protein
MVSRAERFLNLVRGQPPRPGQPPRSGQAEPRPPEPAEPPGSD